MSFNSPLNLSQKSLLLLLALSLVAVTTSVASPAKRCAEASSKLIKARSTPKTSRKALSEGVQHWKSLPTFWQSQIPASVLEEVFEVTDQPQARQKVLELLEDLASASTESSVKSDLLRAAQRAVPDFDEAALAKRVQEFLKSPSSENLWRVVGKLDHSELLEAYVGRDPLKPDPDSWLGQYIKKTGARTMVRRFPKGPNRTLGEEKLVVAVSESSFAAFFEDIAKRPNFLFHVHTPEQGTLAVALEGLYGTYANLSSPMRAPRVGSLLPAITLSSSEAERARLYFQLGTLQHHMDTALTPWVLPGYCATGGYSSCTHWIGNIPVGDKRVTEYAFPGAIDEHASNSISSVRATDRKPRIQKLKAYDTNRLTANERDLVSRVWKVPGNEQLADVIGLRKANLAGELANPGWVAYSLLGSTRLDRVPVVFLVVENHQRPIPRNFPLSIHAY